MQIGFWQVLVIVLLVVLLFGRGKISSLMGDVAQGIKNFKKGMAEETPPAPPPAVGNAADPAPTQTQPASSPATPPSATAAAATPSTTTPSTATPAAGASAPPNSTTPDTRAT